MKPRTVSILYWVFTIVFSLLMLFSAVGGIAPSDGAVKIMHDQLGYPIYFIRFISIAKVLGAIAILVPGLDRIKEWAYAGLFFDLAGAVYSGIAVSPKFDPIMLTMLGWIIPGVLSYVYWRKKRALLVASSPLPTERAPAY